MNHILFIHSSVSGHLIYFHVLATVNSVASYTEGVFLNYRFLQMCAQEWDCWIIWQLYFQFFKKHPYCFPQWCTNLHSYRQGGSLFSILSPVFVICKLFDDAYPYQFEVVPHL